MPTGYQVTSIVAGSFAPIIATFLLREFESSVPIAVYLLIACAISIVALVFTRETRGVDFAEIDAADRENREVRIG